MKSVLITGGQGYIGSQLARELASKHPSLRVTVLDLPEERDHAKRRGGGEDDLQEEFQNIQVFRGDVRSVDLVRVLLQRVSCDCVVHLAAITECTTENVLEFTRVNTIGTHILLELCHHMNVGKFVLVSTDGVYGTSDVKGDHPTSTEKAILNPSSPYAAAHAAAEMMTRAYHRSYNLNCNIVRLSNVYGPKQPAQKVIPNFILSILLRREICVHGDGSSKRNYLHVEDAVRALDSVMHSGIPGEIYNIASRDSCSVMQLLQDISTALGVVQKEVNFTHVADRHFNDVRLCASEKKISNSLGWEQKISLREGLRRTAAWYKEHAIETWGRDRIQKQLDHQSLTTTS
jgi:dTDP-glucose 4,6-dehydratase